MIFSLHGEHRLPVCGLPGSFCFILCRFFPHLFKRYVRRFFFLPLIRFPQTRRALPQTVADISPSRLRNGGVFLLRLFLLLPFLFRPVHIGCRHRIFSGMRFSQSHALQRSPGSLSRVLPSCHSTRRYTCAVTAVSSFGYVCSQRLLQTEAKTQPCVRAALRQIKSNSFPLLLRLCRRHGS